MFSNTAKEPQSQPQSSSPTILQQKPDSQNKSSDVTANSELRSMPKTAMHPQIMQDIPFQMFEVIPNLHLSRFPDVATLPHNISHILNMCMDAHPKSYGRTILHVPIDDIDDITPHMSKILDFIDTSIQSGGSVLVHCALGLNRSAAAVLTYLCHVKETNSFEALEYLKTKKPDVKPSALFLKQIDQYYGRDGEREDPMVGFHRRLQERKAGARQPQGNE